MNWNLKKVTQTVKNRMSSLTNRALKSSSSNSAAGADETEESDSSEELESSGSISEQPIVRPEKARPTLGSSSTSLAVKDENMKERSETIPTSAVGDDKSPSQPESYKNLFSSFFSTSLMNSPNVGADATKGERPKVVLIRYWWEWTPDNMNKILLNFLYDADNTRCNLFWTVCENVFKLSREKICYIILAILSLYVGSNDVSRMCYYAMGVAYPLYKSFRALKYRKVDEYARWLRYWVVYAWMGFADVFFYQYLQDRPVYWTVKCSLVLYMLLPFIKGADLIHRDYIRAFNKRIEAAIEAFSCCPS